MSLHDPFWSWKTETVLVDNNDLSILIAIFASIFDHWVSWVVGGRMMEYNRLSLDNYCLRVYQRAIVLKQL